MLKLSLTKYNWGGGFRHLPSSCETNIVQTPAEDYVILSIHRSTDHSRILYDRAKELFPRDGLPWKDPEFNSTPHCHNTPLFKILWREVHLITKAITPEHLHFPNGFLVPSTGIYCYNVYINPMPLNCCQGAPNCCIALFKWGSNIFLKNSM